MAQLNFNAATVAPTSSPDPIPAGWYNVKITKSQMKPTKAGNASYLELVISVVDGDFANRTLFDRLNLNNPNSQAVEIAYGTLSAICHATGVIQLQDTTQLHGIVMRAKVKINPPSGKYGGSNEIDGYEAAQGAAAAAVAPTWATPQAPAAAQAQAVPAAPPWASPAATQQPAAATPPWAS